MTGFDKETGEVFESATDKLFEALAMAQGEFPAIPKDREVDAGQYKFEYATLDAILTAVRPVLSKHGLAILQPLVMVNGGSVLRTILGHKSGQSIVSDMPLTLEGVSKIQQVGSQITYKRRYAIVSMLGVVADEDDDGTGASGTPAKVTPRQQVSRPTSQSAPAIPAKGGPAAPAPAARPSLPPELAAGATEDSENPAPVQFTEAPGRVKAPAPKQEAPPQAKPAPVARNSPEMKAGLTDFVTIKQKLAAVGTQAEMTALLGAHKPRLDEIGDLGPEAQKGVDELLKRVEARMASLPPGDDARI